MEIKTLYRYTRPDGGITVSTDKPEGAYTELYRLIADEGKILSHADYENTPCIDVDSRNGWAEVETEFSMLVKEDF